MGCDPGARPQDASRRRVSFRLPRMCAAATSSSCSRRARRPTPIDGAARDARRLSAFVLRGVTAVIPYYGYARSDKKDRPRVPSRPSLSQLITTAGADRVLTMDLHASQIQGFFDIPVDHLYAAPVIVGHYQQNPMPKLMVVAPDTGGAERARAYAKRLDAGLALCDKRREKANVAEVMNVVGDVRGRNCLVIDDMCDTGGSLTKVARALQEAGAERVEAASRTPSCRVMPACSWPVPTSHRSSRRTRFRCTTRSANYRTSRF